MRLSKIKLAGFKSFVDPTTIPFPSSLVGVVGPNGCGKSNVIDAVRWVMGESSASRLRGDSITDVIFNGSSSRKPVGAASVELLFDNSETTLEGQYAKYAEISIRREVSRDGISTYFLNGTRCRRKDITGVFLGTGLGPRSYSIIEQGMISRVIEAKPEEMRTFIEEAAGISKYKERRRETANRIKHTKDNLERLADVLDEVEKQIKHLDRQAKTAERYGRYKDEERKTAAELLGLRLRDLDNKSADAAAMLGEKETAHEALVAKQRNIEARIEDARVRQSDRSDEFNEVQGRYYKAGSEIARIEQSIEHAHELRERQQKDLEQAVQGATEVASHIDKDESEIAQLELSLNELVPGLQEARAQQARSQGSLEDAERALAEWQRRWDDFTTRTNAAQQTRNVEETRSEQLKSRLSSLAERRRKLDETQQADDPQALKTAHEGLVAEELRKRQAREEFERHLADIAEKIARLREQDKKLSKLVDERRATLIAAESRYASMEAVQKAALGEGDESVQSWLESSGLEGAERVAQSIDVDDGWERAVETVLGDYLQAVCVTDVAAITEKMAELKKGDLTLLVESAAAGQGGEVSATLANKVSRAPSAVLEILRTVRVADSLDKALSIRDQLSELDVDSSVITQDGVWLSRNWLRVRRDKDAGAGILAREHDMRRLKDEIRELKARSDSAGKLARDGRTRLSQLEESREKVQSDAATLLDEYSDTKARLDAARFQLDQATARQQAISEETTDIEKERSVAEEQARSSQTRFLAGRRDAEFAAERTGHAGDAARRVAAGTRACARHSRTKTASRRTISPSNLRHANLVKSRRRRASSGCSRNFDTFVNGRQRSGGSSNPARRRWPRARQSWSVSYRSGLRSRKSWRTQGGKSRLSRTSCGRWTRTGSGTIRTSRHRGRRSAMRVCRCRKSAYAARALPSSLRRQSSASRHYSRGWTSRRRSKRGKKASRRFGAASIGWDRSTWRQSTSSRNSRSARNTWIHSSPT